VRPNGTNQNYERYQNPQQDRGQTNQVSRGNTVKKCFKFIFSFPPGYGPAIEHYESERKKRRWGRNSKLTNQLQTWVFLKYLIFL